MSKARQMLDCVVTFPLHMRKVMQDCHEPGTLICSVHSVTIKSFSLAELPWLHCLHDLTLRHGTGRKKDLRTQGRIPEGVSTCERLPTLYMRCRSCFFTTYLLSKTF